MDCRKIPLLFSFFLLLFLHPSCGVRVPLSSSFSCNPSCHNPHGQTRGGNLTVSVVEVTGVEDTDGWGPFAGLPDVYVTIELGNVVRSTSSVSESVNPAWPDGGEPLSLGAQKSGSIMTLSIFDLDEGLEFDDDLIASTTLRVMDCSCFDSDTSVTATCNKQYCVEEAWVPLKPDQDCSGRDSWPWSSQANPDALCIRLRMQIEPFRVDIVKLYEPSPMQVTTASVQDPGNPPPGHWGRMYMGNDEPLDSNYPGFHDLKGGLIVQTSPIDRNQNRPGPYAIIASNLDATIYVFRKMDDYPYQPPWLQNASRWSPTPYFMVRFGEDASTDPTVRFKALSAELRANHTFDLGYPEDRLYDESGARYSNNAMYVVVVVMKIFDDIPENAYRSEFEKSTFFPLLFEMVLAVLPFAFIQRPFWRNIGWRMDRIESGILNGASQDESVNLIALVFKPIYQNGSKANIDFRRNLFFVTLATKITLMVPIATCLSYSFAMAFLAVPAAAGIAVFTIGIGVSIIMYCALTWARSGWRMSRSRLYGFTVGFGFLYAFLFLSVTYDMRVIDAGLPYSIFSLTCVGFTLNTVPLVAIFFLDNDQLHQAFSQLQKVVDKNSKVAAVKNKFQALGTMGLKMALLSNKMKNEQGIVDDKKSNKKNKKKMAFGALLGSIFTIDDSIPAFRYSDMIRRWFTGGKKHRKKLVRTTYTWSLVILFVYSMIVYFKCDPKNKSQGFGLSFVVVVLDTSLFALLRGPCMWETGKYVSLSFAGRALLAFFSGENWIVGVGLAYFVYGKALGTEIINQRMRTFSSDRAGAIAYFGQATGKRKRKHDVSAMPEFVLGALSFFFLVALLAYVFKFSADEIPSVTIGGQQWKAWIFGVIAFVVVTVNVVLGLATRALMLQREGLLKSKSYLMWKGFDLPMQLVALAELLVVMSGLLIYAMTGSLFVFTSSVFWPVIFGCVYKVYAQWVANDFSLFQPKKKRVEDVDSDDSSDEEEEEEVIDDSDDPDDELGLKDKGNKEGAKTKKTDSDTEESEEEEDSEEDSTDDEDGQDMKQKLIGNISKLNDRIGKGGLKPKITMPKVAFRKPINLAQKVDKSKYDDSSDEEEEKKEGEEKEDEKKEEETQAIPEQDKNDDENSESKKLLAPEEDNTSTEVAVTSGKNKLVVMKQKAMRRLKVIRVLLDPRRIKRKVKTVYQEKKSKAKELWLTKYRPKLKEKLKISDEQDPVKMTDLEALWYGKLTPLDYSMLNAVTITSVLIIFYGLVVSWTERNAWWGNTIWFMFFWLVFSFAPIRKYYGTQTISDDMIWCFKFSMFLEFVGSLILFVDVLGAGMTHTSSLWLFLGLFLWPCVLVSVVILLIWRDSDWRLKPDHKEILEKCFKFLVFCGFNAVVFLGIRTGFILLLFTAIFIISVKLLQIWSKNGFYLPIRYQYLLDQGLNCMALMFAFLSVVLTNNTGIFFCLCVTFGAVLARLLTQLASINSTLSSATPLYFSQFIFPIYSLDPVTNDLKEQNQIGVLIFCIQFVIFLFGVACIVFINPLEVGVGIVSLSFVLLLTTSSYLISRTPIWMASATLCIDEKELKETANQSRTVFEKRRSNFEIICDEFVQRDKQEKRLNKFASWNQKKVVEFEKRYAAKEMVEVVFKAEQKLKYDRLGKPRKDRVLDWRQSFTDAYFTGKGPLAPFTLAGGLHSLYKISQDPSLFRRGNAEVMHQKKKKKRKSAKEKKGPLDESDDEDSDESEIEEDQLDRLIDELGPGGDILKIRVLDWDLTSANDDLGFIEIELDELEPDELIIDWYELESSEKKEGTKEEATGKIQVQVEVANVFSEDKDLQVRVVVMRARGLRAADNDGVSDPFCIVECGTFSRRTPVIHKTLDPDWTEARGGGRFTFPPTDDTLQVEIRDKDLLTSDFLGGIDIYLPDLMPNEEVIQYYELEGGHGKTRATGEIKLALLTSAPVNEYGLKESKASLQVTVISAKGIRAADRGGTSDPFCVVKCGLDAFSTSVVKKTLTPKWIESYTFNPDPFKSDQEDEDGDAIDNVDFLDCWKVFQQLPKLDKALAREYEEEMRANTLFQMLLVVASEGRKSKEAILFQRFLREYRFKLLANKIEPPRNIFKSKSWATVDVKLVALWLLRLTPEQRDRFYALKQVFTKEVEKIEERRQIEDEQYAEHALSLESWQEQWDEGKNREQAQDFEQRRLRREQEGKTSNDPRLPKEPEIVINAREMLEEISKGRDAVATQTPDGEKTMMYNDPVFPATAISTAGIVNEYMLKGWARAKDINPEVELFAGGTDPDDVAQGILCNGWFLSAVSILAASGSVGDEEVDPLIDNLFITKAKTDCGAYAVRLYKNGVWQLVIVDDQFPVLDDRYKTEQNGGVAGSHSLKFEEMWVSVLEKAYAKTFQTYSMLENGYVHQALRTLTGCNSVEMFLLKESKGPARVQLWQNLLRFKENGFLLGCGTISNNSANVEVQDSGLLLGSCYAIYQVRTVDGHRLLQLRNPPGATSEFKGDWSDNSPLWTTRLKRKLGVVNDEEDGTFWMSFDDFLLSFRSLYVSYYYDPAVWSFVKLRGCWDTIDKTAVGLPSKHNPDCKLHRNPQWVIDIQRPCDLHIKISQTLPGGDRVYECLPFAAMLIHQSEAERLRHVDRVRMLRQKEIVAYTGNPDRSVEKHMYVTLNPGFYVLLVGCYMKDTEGPFQVQVDSSFPVGISQLYPRPEKIEVAKTETVIAKEIDVSKLSRKQKLKMKLENKLEKLIQKFNEKKEKAEIFVEKKFELLDAAAKKRLGIELKEILPKFKEEEVVSDDEEEEKGVVKAELNHADTNAAIKDIVETKEEPMAKPKVEEPPKVNPNYVKQLDPNSGQYYYWNKVTNQTTWDQPADFYLP